MSTLTPIERIARERPPSPYDLSTYTGRVCHLAQVTNPLLMLEATHANLTSAQSVVSQVEGQQEGFKAVEPSTYWKAKTLVGSAIHPDTKEVIPTFGRFCAFMPANIPILLGMLHPSAAASAPLMMFWQWSNQTYNVAVNYCNRNASSSLTAEGMFKSYLAAVALSCSISVLGKKMLDAWKSAPFIVRMGVPFVSVSAASATNVALMRSSDWTEGVGVQGKESGEVLLDGKPSLVAGKTAISQVAATRVLTCVPLLMAPPVIMAGFERLPAFAKASVRTKMLINCAVLAGVLQISIPTTLAYFPQTAELPVSDLEHDFRECAAARGIDRVVFNKGL